MRLYAVEILLPKRKPARNIIARRFRSCGEFLRRS
jgi:hypothetical protein